MRRRPPRKKLDRACIGCIKKMVCATIDKNPLWGGLNIQKRELRVKKKRPPNMGASWEGDWLGTPSTGF